MPNLIQKSRFLFQSTVYPHEDTDAAKIRKLARSIIEKTGRPLRIFEKTIGNTRRLHLTKI